MLDIQRLRLDATIESIIVHAEDYQKTKDCYFGESDQDFRNALYRFAVLELEVCGFLDFYSESGQHPTDEISLREWIVPMLEYYGVYFNDEGESWDRADDFPEYSEYNFSPYNLPMREFFKDPQSWTREAVIRFMKERWSDKEVLRKHSSHTRFDYLIEQLIRQARQE